MLGGIVMYHTLFAPAVMLLCGLLLAFRGRWLVPFALVVVSLIMGFVYGGAAAASLTENPILIRWAPLLIAVLFSVLAVVLFRTAFFVSGIVLGFFLAGVFLPDLPVFFASIAALGTGALVYFFRNFVFSVLTALIGAALTAAGAVNLLAWVEVSAGTDVYWIITVLTACFGIFCQVKKGRKRN